MSKKSADTMRLGYSLHRPSGGPLLRLRISLSQFSDLFSHFNKYIAPAYYHDRCERSVHMRLYSMHKRDIVILFMGFLSCFGLMILIGLAGPPITVTSELTAKSILSKTTLTYNTATLATGPFVMMCPLMTTYSQQLWLIARVMTTNNDDERYDKSFKISATLDGVNEQHKPLTRLVTDTIRNRTRHLNCEGESCEEFTLLHLGFLDYTHYVITVHFYGLESFHQKYNIREITFYFKSYNPEFTQIEIWFRFIFLLFTFIVICWYAHTLRKYPSSVWSIEQKWISVLLPFLLLYNNPFFSAIFLMNSWLPGMLDAVLQTSFLCLLLLFWLCIYHGLRQNDRRFLRFHLPKIIVVLPIWISAMVLAIWEKYNERSDPTFSHFVDTNNYNGLKLFFYISGCVYVVNLSILVIRAYSELRSMPFFDMRLKILTLLMIFVLSISASLAMCRFGFSILQDNFVATLNTTYRSSAEFMSFYSLLNIYLYTMAYVYSPDDNFSQAGNYITKDNPTFSMIVDSDEEVVYGSEDESRRPLTLTTNNDYDSD